MGCGTSIYDSSRVTKNPPGSHSTVNNKTDQAIRSPSRKNSNRITPGGVDTGLANHHTNREDRSILTERDPQLPPNPSRSSKKNENSFTRSSSPKDVSNHRSTPLDSPNHKSRSHRNGILCNSDSGRLSSPANSDRTDGSRTVKHVGFKDETELSKRHEDRSPQSTDAYHDRKYARRKRDRTLRNRLLSKMSEVEIISARLLIESDRLSLTSSMSRTTSRTGSPFPAPLFYRPSSAVTSSSIVST